MNEQLYKKDKNGNILIWKIELFFRSTAPILSKLVVTYGRFNGKLQIEETLITEGKANRTVQEQAHLQFNSLIGKQKDKGYKSLKDLQYVPVAHEEGDYRHTTLQSTSPLFNSFEEFLKYNLPKDSTDAQGRPKPMKCTALQDTKTNGLKENVLKKIKFPCQVQPKLDGVRCVILHENGKWIAISSSGKSYNVAARHILDEIETLNLPTDLMFDGELYIHGEPLEYLSGLARKQNPTFEQLRLEFHIFDLVHSAKQQKRLDLLSYQFQSKPRLFNSTCIHRVPSSNARNQEELDEFFKYYSEAGYEGVIVRNNDGDYKQGTRSSQIFKWKAFQDAEYEITGIELGKRGVEDLVFVLKTEDGKEFKAKPLGSASKMQSYALNLEKIKGKKATVQFLTLSQGGIPQGNPRIKALRNYE